MNCALCSLPLLQYHIHIMIVAEWASLSRGAPARDIDAQTRMLLLSARTHEPTDGSTDGGIDPLTQIRTQQLTLRPALLPSLRPSLLLETD